LVDDGKPNMASLGSGSKTSVAVLSKTGIARDLQLTIRPVFFCKPHKYAARDLSVTL
jgi:hypothetical protein